ncbi:MAG: hypothetical protein HOW73_33925 [Polyangiaceae bacterium]|nr:hypothetical protein [Polyangiaceae bacterium]
MARALTHRVQPDRPLTIRGFPDDGVARVLGAAGKTIEPDEVRDMEHLFQRIYFEDFPLSNFDSTFSGYLYYLGSLVTVGIAGRSDPQVIGLFAEQASLIPAPGSPMSLSMIATALEQGGCETLRPEIVLFAAHQYEVATSNNDALKKIPLGTKFTDVKGMSFVPNYNNLWGEPDSVAIAEQRLLDYPAIDFAYRSDFGSPPGAKFDLGEIAETNAVSAAELGAYMAGVEGIRTLRAFDEVMTMTDVESPPFELWAHMLNPGHAIGQRLRILSAVLDRLEADGELRTKLLFQSNLHPEAGSTEVESRLTRDSFIRSLPSLLYHARDQDRPDEEAGKVFVEGGFNCGGPSVCPISIQRLFDAARQKARKWYRPEVRFVRGPHDEQIFMPYARIPDFRDPLNTSTAGSKLLADLYVQNGYTIEPSDVDPLAVELDPPGMWWPPSHELVHIAVVNGHSYDVYRGALWRDGDAVTPSGFELGGTITHAYQTPLIISDRIYFVNGKVTEAVEERGMLVYDMAQDVWMAGQPAVETAGWHNLTFDGKVLSGLEGYQDIPRSADLSAVHLQLLREVRLPEAARPPCTHLVSETGGPLVSGCESAATSVCDLDPYCCDEAWDDICVSEVDGK